MGEVRQNWIFTFCGDMPLAGYYIKIYGTYSETRDKMFEKFGDKRGFQYTEEFWNDYVKDAKQYALDTFGDEKYAVIEKELIIEI